MVAQKSKILLLGIDAQVRALLPTLVDSFEVVSFDNRAVVEKAYENWTDGHFSIILCGGAIADMSPIELAQVTKAVCPMTPKYLVTEQLVQVRQKALIKNGMDGIFWLPVDQGVLKKTLEEKLTNSAQVIFRTVKLIDVDPSTKLDFDTYVYLPLNRKHVRFSAADSAIGEARLSRLQKHSIGTVQINAKDIDRFYAHAAGKFRSLTKGQSALIETERQRKLQESIRSIIFDIYDVTEGPDFNQARQFMASCQGIVSSYITNGESNDWYQRILGTVGQSYDAYDHAANVSTYAALFGMALDFPNPEDLAIAGLFHDIGAVCGENEGHHWDMSEVQESEKAAIRDHSANGLNVLKNKRMIINEVVEEAILQHHERFDGKGYPKNVVGPRISREAQLISFADQFDSITCAVPGQLRVTPAEALKRIAENGSIDPDLIRRLRGVLPPSVIETQTKIAN